MRQPASSHAGSSSPMAAAPSTAATRLGRSSSNQANGSANSRSTSFVGSSQRAVSPMVTTSETPGKRWSACSASDSQPAVICSNAMRLVAADSSAVARSLA